jgi:ribosomal-protein-serine acetyltransferase
VIVARIDLVGSRIVMRPNSVEFADQLHAAAMESIATVGRWMPWCHSARTLDEGVTWLRNSQSSWDSGAEYEFTLFTPSGEYLGAAGLNQFNRVHNFANLGYWVRESRQRQGIALEATTLLAAFGFRNVGLTRLEIIVAEQNHPSRGLAEKLGATCEGIARNRLLLRGIPIPAAVYSLVPGVDP